MSTRPYGRMRVGSEARTPQLIPSSVLGTLLFVVVEIMLFAGFISAFSIVKASAIVWPPPDQPRLPLEATALNTAALLASGVLLFLARRTFRKNPVGARKPLLASMALGSFFVIFQGVEWVKLIQAGLTLTSSNLGSFFYTIIGVHALHAVAALILLAYVWWQLQQGRLRSSLLAAAEVFWYFVAGVWPVLYVTVYL
ncbi:MAG: heme-copper oxidase subunit III [Myxococcales bacterium]|nr:heme-copper oxidase subunit III [Myxococcales bacterium]